ncbi:MAG TPA: hypothetical protein VM578_05735 [Candidatus Saccharimonadales bacterium]|nr:hypothetical protein [Candidatus Saccharimonadales bacterium]
MLERCAIRFVTLLTLVFVASAIAPSTAQEPPRPPILSAHARLMAARAAYIENTGSRLPNDVIGDAFQGWGHYTIVGDLEKADIIIAISAPVSDSGVNVGSGDGRPSSSSKTLSSSMVTQIRLTILDARNRVVLWSGSEQPKSSMKERQREDNILDASLRLFRRFRITIEPETAP